MLSNYIKTRKQKLYDFTDEEIQESKKSGIKVLIRLLIAFVLIIWGMCQLSISAAVVLTVLFILITFYAFITLFVVLMFIESKRRSKKL